MSDGNSDDQNSLTRKSSDSKQWVGARNDCGNFSGTIGWRLGGQAQIKVRVWKRLPLNQDLDEMRHI